jgi:sulfur carrier protein ThiS
MSTVSTTERCTEVTLLHPDGASQSLTLPEGATLADLLREAGAAIPTPNVLIDGRPLEEALVLKSGMMIAILPEPPQAPPKKDWRSTVGTVQDTPAFRAMIEEGRAIREADREAARKQAEQDDL